MRLKRSANLLSLSQLPVPEGKQSYFKRHDWDIYLLHISSQEMAGTIVYLASPAGAYVNGHEIVVDGGYLAVNP